jgi:amino acid adenylation domain-containing protein
MSASSISELLRDKARTRPSNTALVTDDQSLSYSELNTAVSEFAQHLSQQGIEEGDRIAVYMPKSIKEVLAMLAANRIGAVFVNVNAHWSFMQLEHVLTDCEVRMLMTSDKLSHQLNRGKLPQCVQTIIVDGNPIEDARAQAWPSTALGHTHEWSAPAAESLAAILYTSGSTGKPKGVMLSNENLILSAQTAVEHLGNTPDDRLLVVLPFSFDYGLSQLTSMLTTGGAIILQAVALPAEITKSITRHKATGLSGVPSMWLPLVDLLEESPESFTTLRYITNSGDAIPNAYLRKMRRVFEQQDIVLMYGLTEGFRATYVPPNQFEAKEGAIGVALPNVRLWVVEPGVGPCKPGQEGLLMQGGPLLSMGYWNNPEATSKRFAPAEELRELIGDENVLHTGDHVRQDDDGFIWFLGRGETFIKCGGFRISPHEVESVVWDSDLVSVVAAFSVPNDRLGETVAIAAQPKAGDTLDTRGILAYCRIKMPNYMVPRNIFPWQGAIPRTGSGKVDRKTIKQGCLASLEE